MHAEGRCEVLSEFADRKITDFEPFGDMRNDIFGAELANRVAYCDLVVGQRRVEAERVVRVESRRFVSAHWLILPSSGRRSH
jgi:hypothetical protein